ncbi:MAG: aspartate aminotransferase family protein [Chloroflexi bacterium]|nr:MAG: aspartate aminotransferase family protein [Chloroflexota bacterium]
MDARQVIEAEARYLVPTYPRPPFVLTRGEGVYLYDSEGRRYTDWVAGIAVNALGYGDPEIVAALQEAAAGLIHVSNLYHTAPHVALAEALVRHSFADRVYFANSGTEAVEAAIKFSRKWARTHFGPGKTQIVAFTGSFHGRTMGALALTAREKYQAPFRPLMPDVVFARFNDLASAEAAIGPRTAAVIVEPVQGEGGIHPADDAFLQGLRELCDRHGAALIFDEIQCGLGRTGTLWAHEPSGVRPDLMTLAKPLGGGLPIGATLVTEAIAGAIGPGDHGSTFAAGPLVTTIALRVFRRIADPTFLASVREKGETLVRRLREAQLPHVVEVRGRGLMIGLELTVSAKKVVERGYEAGLLLVNAGDTVLRLIPPLVIGQEQVDELLEKLPRILEQAAG